MKVTVKLIESENEFIASCPELDISCYAINKDEAVKRIINILQFYVESAREMGLKIENLDSIKIEGLVSKQFQLNEHFFEKSELIN